MPVVNAVSAVTRAVDERVGWNRIAFAISLLIIAIAAATLFRLLRDVDVDEVIVALKDTPPRTVLLAGLLVAAGYVSLTFYDFFALRTIGRRRAVSDRRARELHQLYDRPQSRRHRLHRRRGAAAHLLAVGPGRRRHRQDRLRHRAHFLARQRLHPRPEHGLRAGCRQRSRPVASMAQSRHRARRVGGDHRLRALAPARARRVGAGVWQITLPNASLTFVQIGIRILDLSIGALAMYVLLPNSPSIDFLTLLVTFVLATLLGFLSHAPGSLGVFDAAMLVGLSLFDRNELVASLLLFRLLYFILPFFTALCILSARELWLSLTGSANEGPAPD